MKWSAALCFGFLVVLSLLAEEPNVPKAHTIRVAAAQPQRRSVDWHSFAVSSLMTSSGGRIGISQSTRFSTCSAMGFTCDFVLKTGESPTGAEEADSENRLAA